MHNSNQQTIALTGATGFLGSHLMASLLKGDFRVVVLGRSSKDETLAERIAQLLQWFGLEDKGFLIELVEIDLLKPMMGLYEAQYSTLAEKTDQIIHCASDTSFSERKRSQIIETNVSSLTGILEFASNGKPKRFNYISTAYVAGIIDGLCSEQLVTNTKFYNAYEESKANAENIISTYCSEHLIPLNIIRPPIVYGDSRTGRSLKFNALYYHVKSLQFIRDIYLNDINIRNGVKSAECGISLDGEGFLIMPLRIYLPHEGTINLIPVDYFVDATLLIVNSNIENGIYHITSEAPSRIETLVTYIGDILKIKGIEIIYHNSNDVILRNPPEELFDRFIEQYRPYLSDTRIFERSNIAKLDKNVHPPTLSYDIFKRCMEYAINIGWGDKGFI